MELDREFATFIQSWLYFELLSVVTDESINIDTFQHSEDASRLDSSPLKGIVARWSKSMISDSSYDKEAKLKDWYNRVSSCLFIPSRKGHDSKKAASKDGTNMSRSSTNLLC